MNQRNWGKVGLFTLLGLLTLLMIGSGFSEAPGPENSGTERLARRLATELAPAERDAWNRAAAADPLWLLRITGE